MTKRSKEYIKRQREAGIIIVKAMIPESKKDELSRIARHWREEHKLKGIESDD
jgi:hypothetical protein